MSVGLYMGVHVPAAITRALVMRGVDVMTAQLDGTTELDDSSLLDRASVLGRVLFSQDSDLLPLDAKGTANILAALSTLISSESPSAMPCRTWKSWPKLEARRISIAG